MTESALHSRNCLACGSTNYHKWTTCVDREYFTTPDNFDFYHCNDCAALFIDPVPADCLARIYPPTYYSYSTGNRSFVIRVKNWLDARTFRKILSEIKAEGIRVLDVGGGSGSQLDVIRNADSRVKFTKIVDIDRQAEEIARRNGHDYFCGSVDDFQTQQTFHLVVLFNLIEHVSNPVQVLKKIHSTLAPDGLVILQTPNYDSLDERLFRQHNWGGYHCPRHWVLFNETALRQLAEKAGFSVRRFFYTQGAAFWAVSILGLLHDRGWIRLSTQRPAVRHFLFAPLSLVFATLDFLRVKFSKTSQVMLVLARE